MNKHKIIKQKKLAKRIIKNSDRSACCNEKLKTSKLGRVMCTKCNKFCKIVPGIKNNYTTGIMIVAIAIIAVLALTIINMWNK